MKVNLFEKVKDKEITSTEGFQVEIIRSGTDDSEKHETYSSLRHMISEGYIEGVEGNRGCVGPNFKELKVTKTGLEVYKFWKTPINQIGKPTLFEACRNGIVGAFAGKIVWWVITATVLILVPTFSEDAREILKDILYWFIGIIS